jgi:hypothetical protein
MTSELESLKKRIEELEKAAKPAEPFVPGPRFQFDPTAGASMSPAAMQRMIDAVPSSVIVGLPMMQGVQAPASRRSLQPKSSAAQDGVTQRRSKLHTSLTLIAWSMRKTELIVRRELMPSRRPRR